MMIESHGRPQEIVLADWAQGMRRSVLRQMIGVVSQQGILSLAGGLPAPEFFPSVDYARALASVLESDPLALQYRPPFEKLKSQIVELMALRGVRCSADQVFITSGAQQGLDVLTRLLLNPGGQVMLEEIVYTGVQQAIFPRHPRILSIPTHLEYGMDVNVVEHELALGARPAYIYAIPDAHNPLGVSMDLEGRRRLVDLAQRYGIPIIEDDPYGFLQYTDQDLPPLRSLDDEWVFYVGSFSKIMAPALRLGWIIAPKHLLPQLTVIKEAGDLESSALTQRAVSAYLETGSLGPHLQILKEEYGRRRLAMLDALDRYFPTEAQWTHPVGGMFVWVELPPEIDAMALLNRAIDREQVAFIPGQAFALPDLPLVQQRAAHCIRLSYSNCCEIDIFDGIRRLAQVIHNDQRPPILSAEGGRQRPVL